MHEHSNLTLARVLIEDRHRVAATNRRARRAELDATRTAVSARIRRIVSVAGALLATPVLAIAALAASGGQSDLGPVREATAAYHDLAAAEAAGYATFYVCTDEAGIGAMGQHFVNIELVLDPAIDPLHPEVLVYEPRINGGYKLVALEYVTFQEAWAAAYGATTPTVLGIDLKAVSAPNRYGLPPFFQRHFWLWARNPLGQFNDWNPDVTCRGSGDPA